MNIQDITNAVNNRKRIGKTVTDEQFEIIIVGLTDSNNSYKDIGKVVKLNQNTVWTIRKKVTANDKATMDRIARLKIAENFSALKNKHFPSK
jgi:hypothetical protein